jgi:hypothetical protein
MSDNKLFETETITGRRISIMKSWFILMLILSLSRLPAQLSFEKTYRGVPTPWSGMPGILHQGYISSG